MINIINTNFGVALILAHEYMAADVQSLSFEINLIRYGVAYRVFSRAEWKYYTKITQLL